MVIATVFIAVLLIIQLTRLYLSIGKSRKVMQLFEKSREQMGFLDFVITYITTKRRPIEEIFPLYLNRMKETLGWAFHSFFRLDEEGQVLPIRFTGYLPDWYMEELSTKVLVKVGDASVGMAVATKQPVTINSATIDPRFQNVTSYTDRTGYRSLSCYPVMGRLKTHGGFCAYSMLENAFAVHDTKFLLSSANLFGAVLENLLLENYLESKMSFPKS